MALFILKQLLADIVIRLDFERRKKNAVLDLIQGHMLMSDLLSDIVYDTHTSARKIFKEIMLNNVSILQRLKSAFRECHRRIDILRHCMQLVKATILLLESAGISITHTYLFGIRTFALQVRNIMHVVRTLYFSLLVDAACS